MIQYSKKWFTQFWLNSPRIGDDDAAAAAAAAAAADDDDDDDDDVAAAAAVAAAEDDWWWRRRWLLWACGPHDDAVFRYRLCLNRFVVSAILAQC